VSGAQAVEHGTATTLWQIYARTDPARSPGRDGRGVGSSGAAAVDRDPC